MMQLLKLFGLAIGASALAVASAIAADAPRLYAPTIDPQLTAPSYFDGLYLGALTGTVSARHDNFFTAGAPLRTGVTLLGGWGQTIAPGVVAGGEIQASGNTDFVGVSDYDIMALARIGLLSDKRFMTYLVGGLGYFANAGAWEAGIGYDWMASSNLSLRLEGAAIGQLGTVPNGNNLPGVTAVRLMTGAIWHFNGAPDGGAISDPTGGVTGFTGPYAGLYAGSSINPGYDFFADQGYGYHLSRVAIGGIAGLNYGLGDTFRVGVEAQGGANFDSSGDYGVNGFVLARAGIVPVPGLMPYVAGGVGTLAGKGVYAAGGGVEYAMWGHNSLRVEALGVGSLGSSSGMTATQLTFGTLWHFD